MLKILGTKIEGSFKPYIGIYSPLKTLGAEGELKNDKSVIKLLFKKD